MPIDIISITVISSSLLLLPAFIVMRLFRFRSVKRLLFYFAFSVYLCVVYALTGPPDITYFRWDPNITLIPFVGMVGDIRSTALNVALFLPLGIGLPFLWEKYDSFYKTALFGLLLSLGIEIAQLFTFRATDVNDLLTNLTGTVLGYLLCKAVSPRRSDRAGDDAPLLLGISCGVMFFAEPFLYGVLYRLF